jgi:hypothetical protein
MKHPPQAIDPATGNLLPRPGNEHRARRRRTLSARLRGPHAYVPPTGGDWPKATHARQVAGIRGESHD